LKIVVVLTPFFVLTMFLALTEGYTEAEKRRLALRVSGAVFVVVLSVFFCGKWIFSLFSLTLEAFEIGAGVLLFLTAISLVQGRIDVERDPNKSDPAVVPLAIPIMVGPGTIGTLMVMGATPQSARERLIAALALLAATCCVCLLLFISRGVERALGRARLSVLSKLTGVLLASLAAQMIFTGIRHFLLR
jgi:multiple antibiotic resistance protein